jgi:hypothetical protein
MSPRQGTNCIPADERAKYATSPVATDRKEADIPTFLLFVFFGHLH